MSEIPNVSSICHGCALAAGATCPANMVVTVWEDECGICGEVQPCCAVRDYDWPSVKHIFD